MSPSLSHIRVLDLTTHLSGPWCAMILADHGADVVKVERPDGGDDMRGTPPYVEGESAPFMLWNRNKRSVALNLKDSGDLAEFKRLASTADVLVENFKPGTAARLGIGYDAMHTLNPRIVYCSISGFGQTGPLRASRGVRPHRVRDDRPDEHQRPAGRPPVPHPGAGHRSLRGHERRDRDPHRTRRA